MESSDRACHPGDFQPLTEFRENLSLIFRITGWMDLHFIHTASEARQAQLRDGLDSSSTTTQPRRNLLMTTKISQWQRIALLTAGISASMASVSWAGNPFGLYQLHSDGTVWQYLQQPCQENVCNGWQQILNGSSGAVQLVGGGPGELFALLFQNNEWIDGYTGRHALTPILAMAGQGR
jgi:hypothetical protein